MDIEICKALGVDGVVIGALTPKHNRQDTIKRLVDKQGFEHHLSYGF